MFTALCLSHADVVQVEIFGDIEDRKGEKKGLHSIYRVSLSLSAAKQLFCCLKQCISDTFSL